MKISSVEIQHIAELSRIELDDNELEKYGQQLGTILNYITQLNEVNTKKVEITAQVSDLKNVFRGDEVKNWDPQEIVIALGQGDLEQGQVKVKRVL